jgi:type VI protein secretion system component VasK
LEKTIGLGQTKAKAEKAIGQARQYFGNDSPLMTAADIGRLFQPALFTTSPDLDLLVNEHNEPYIKGLRGLAESLDRLGQALAADRPAAITQAQAALLQAKQAHAALADKFSDAGSEGFNKQLSDLLYQPLRWAELATPKIPKPGANKDGELAKFCTEIKPILMKYPFKLKGKDADLDDLKRGFAPNVGLVWKYVQGSGADLVVRSESGREWKPNPALKDLKVAPELSAFLTRAQQVTDAFFAQGGMTPQLRYTLRSASGPAIRLRLDGVPFSSRDPIRKDLLWPGQESRAEAWILGDVEVGFANYPGLWGVFKLFENADPRPEGTHIVQWSESRGRGTAEPQRISPPVKIDVHDFPGGVDIFNPRFFEALQCPKRAVVPE